jgi:hypothetical protein
MLGFEGQNKTGLDVIPALLVDLEDVQTVTPGLSLSSEDASHSWTFLLSFQVVMLAAISTLSMSWHPVVGSLSSV